MGVIRVQGNANPVTLFCADGGSVAPYLEDTWAGGALQEAAASLAQKCGSQARALVTLQEAERAVMVNAAAYERQQMQDTGAAQVYPDGARVPGSQVR